MIDKEKLKADFEKGLKYDDLAKKYGTTKGTISKYKKRYGWKRNKKHKQQKQNIKVSKNVSDDDLKLSVKQQKFANRYIATGNAYKSAIYAGYSKTYANNGINILLGNIGIKNYINQQMLKQNKYNIAKADEVLQYFTDVLRGKAKETVFVSTGTDVYQKQKEPDSKTRIAAGKEILKRYPEVDAITKAKLDKIKAETNIKEIQAKIIDPDNNDEIKPVFNLMKKLDEGLDEHHKNSKK